MNIYSFKQIYFFVGEDTQQRRRIFYDSNLHTAHFYRGIIRGGTTGLFSPAPQSFTDELSVATMLHQCYTACNQILQRVKKSPPPLQGSPLDKPILSVLLLAL
jgi:hypothetical protein